MNVTALAGVDATARHGILLLAAGTLRSAGYALAMNGSVEVLLPRVTAGVRAVIRWLLWFRRHGCD
jgi:hypothetical protein